MGSLVDPFESFNVEYLYAGSLSRATDVPTDARWLNLRPKSDAMAGRQVDLAHLTTTVQRHRTVVLTGPVGVGKTRVALEVAAGLLDWFQDGVAVAELGTVTPEFVDLPTATVDTRDTVDALLHRDDDPAKAHHPDRRMLLVLDNAEHVIGVTAALVQRLLRAYPGLHIVITSLRAPCAIPAEVWEVPPLPVDPLTGAATYPAAVDLFRCRAQCAVPTLDLSDQMTAVADLCKRVDGLPLAVEIAASRVRSVPLGVMLSACPLLPILDHESMGGLSHHRSLSQGAKWAYDLLDERQQAVLCRLAHLPDEFVIDDVLNSTSGNPKDGIQIVSILAELVDFSAVRVKRGKQYVYEVSKLMREYINSNAA